MAAVHFSQSEQLLRLVEAESAAGRPTEALHRAFHMAVHADFTRLVVEVLMTLYNTQKIPLQGSAPFVIAMSLDAKFPREHLSSDLNDMDVLYYRLNSPKVELVISLLKDIMKVVCEPDNPRVTQVNDAIHDWTDISAPKPQQLIHTMIRYRGDAVHGKRIPAYYYLACQMRFNEVRGVAHDLWAKLHAYLPAVVNNGLFKRDFDAFPAVPPFASAIP